MLSIIASDFHWMEGVDSAEDLCLHGNAKAIIGDEVLVYDNATVSSTALYLLKSLKEDHKIYESNQIFPCCGFFMIASEDLSRVDICGCPNGVDWSILHENGNVVLVTESGKRTEIPFEEYKTIVFAFADQVEAFYHAAVDKKMPEDPFDRNAYIAFWNEWKAIRYGI